ncbi:SDR family oxidoreductase [Nocardia sp. CDC159]|uniref:SDR family oxidoreductase n=1 Tax=Nocardia pulmonis TaxID=2951408 RepID=A0A9X2E814_9NOCA|nr:MULTISPECIES: SDR family oxidoreductase [Nocardia]MCM6775459.1 SDR family oxidoreductase [Nocardia pulmonis]MCM6787807.1 SDR family oxidoreductase [Nocardia sp. CDC159]
MNAADDFRDRVALVTGGAGSVGQRIVRRLAAAGATVIINCFHSYDAAKALAAELVRDGHRCGVLRASVAKQNQVERMFHQLEDDYGRLDVLVNNAATGVFAGWDELTEQHLDQAFATNVKGALWCARAARPLLARSEVGCIVNVSSIGAGTAPANYVGVGVSKAGLEALTRYLAAEFAADGIRVNTASAGLIDNPVGRMFPDFESMGANTRAATPLGRLAVPDDLANVVMLLASPAAGWITGQTLLADGGLSLQRSVMAPTTARPAATVSDPVEIPRGADDSDPIAVVGMGLAVPGASDPAEFWSLLTDGAELFVEVPADRWPVDSFHDPDPTAADKNYQRRSGFLTALRPHPALAAEGVDERSDFTELWLRHSIFQALDGVVRTPGDRVTACFGYTPDGSQHLEETLVRAELAAMLASTGRMSHLSDEVANLLDGALPHGRVDGESPLPYAIGRRAIAGVLPEDTRLFMVDTACSSSLYSIDLGLRDLLADRADIAVCGGAFALAPSGSVLFSKLGGLSRTGELRALDRDADGVLFSDGAGAVVLKRLSRARADGDRVLGLIAGVGLSADGKGRAIYAPARAGQELATSRALRKSGVGAAEVDWVIAHATGTPAGDEVEFDGLRTMYGGSDTVPVTSNKSLIGHTGWAAGVVSVIHALLALRHDLIPAQYRFTAAPDRFRLASTNLTIPTAPMPFPRRDDRPRTVAVSGFGFGGTNAHLLVQEHRPDLSPRCGYGGAPHRAPLVVVGRSAQVGGVEPDGIAEWAARPRGGRHTFGPHYPSPPFPHLRIPPATVRATDRTQLMIVECMRRLDPRIHDYCRRHRESVGVVVGHTGPTRNAVLYALRAYGDELMRAAASSTDPEALVALVKQVREDVNERIAAPTEDSFPGEMPNVIAARLCNYFDLCGLSITVDGGNASLADAFDVAARYLEFGDIELALVAGVNGNSLECLRRLLSDRLPHADADIGEGAFLFAVTDRHTAERENLPILAELEQIR